MSTFIHCSVVGVVPLYPKIGKIIWSAPVSCVLDHHDVNIILHNGRLYSRNLGNGSLCVPMYQPEKGRYRDLRTVNHGGPEKGRYRNIRTVNHGIPENGRYRNIRTVNHGGPEKGRYRAY